MTCRLTMDSILSPCNQVRSSCMLPCAYLFLTLPVRPGRQPAYIFSRAIVCPTDKSTPVEELVIEQYPSSCGPTTDLQNQQGPRRDNNTFYNDLLLQKWLLCRTTIRSDSRQSILDGSLRCVLYVHLVPILRSGVDFVLSLFEPYVR